MKFSERFYAVLDEKSKDRGWQSSFAASAGISQDALSKIISRSTKSPGIDTVSAIVDALGMEVFSPVPTIRRLGSRSPSEAVTGESLPTVPVYGSTGAGEPTELFSGEPETLIQVLPQYNLPDVAAFCVDGDSMEPTIMKGSYVGVVPFSGNISEGGIYLVNMPPFGRVIKRIRMGASGSIELHSDNKVYQPIPLPFEGYEEIVKGKVVWIWQLC